MGEMSMPAASEDARWRYPSYYLKRQLLKLIGAGFFIYEPSGALCFYVHQKGFKLKEDIRVYADDKQTQELLTIRARQIMDFSAAYDVVDAISGQKVGMLKRKGWKSIARDEWEVCDANDQPYGVLVEDSMLLALIRRFLSNLVPQNYDLLIGGQRVLDVRQNFNPFSYHLNIVFEQGVQYPLDPRMGIASAVLLAAIEGRQK